MKKIGLFLFKSSVYWNTPTGTKWRTGTTLRFVNVTTIIYCENHMKKMYEFCKQNAILFLKLKFLVSGVAV
jgi:hypothetical protein